MSVFDNGRNLEKKVKQPNTIMWVPHELYIEFPPIKESPIKWLIKTQFHLKIESKEGKRIGLSFGYKMSKGIVLVTLSSKWKLHIGIMNKIQTDEECNDIIVYMYNFSNQNITVPAGEIVFNLQYLF